MVLALSHQTGVVGEVGEKKRRPAKEPGCRKGCLGYLGKISQGFVRSDWSGDRSKRDALGHEWLRGQLWEPDERVGKRCSWSRKVAWGGVTLALKPGKSRVFLSRDRGGPNYKEGI